MNLFLITFTVSIIVFLSLTAKARPTYTLALAILIFVVSFFPVIWGSTLSFFDFYPGRIHFVGLANLCSALTDPGLALSARITAIWSLLTLMLELIVSYALALTLLSLKKISKIFYPIVLIPWAVPSYISIISWTVLIEGYGGNSFLSRLFGSSFDMFSSTPIAFFWTAFVHAWLDIPLMTIIIMSAMQTVSPQLRSLSRLEGMNPLEEAVNVYIPYTFPVVFPYIFISFLRSFKDFSTIFLMTRGGPPLAYGFGPRSIVGSTTILGMFVYDKFGSTQNYGTLGAYSVAVGAIMLILVIVGWNYRTSRKRGLLITYAIVAHVIFDSWGMGSGLFGIVPVCLYIISLISFKRRSKAFKNFFCIGALVDGIYILVGTLHSGFEAVSLSGTVSILIAMTLIFKGKIHVSPFRIPDSLWKSAKYIWLTLWSIVVILPLWNIVIMAFSRKNILPVDRFVPYGFTFSNFATLFKDYDFANAIKNTLVICTIAVSVAILTIFPATYAAASSKRALRIGKILVFTSFFHGMHTLIPLAMTFRSMGLMDKLLGIGIAVAVHGAVLAYFILYPFLSGLPKDIDEAAKVDGAGGFTRMIHIILPVALPSLITTSIFIFITGWNSFVLPLILLNSPKLYPLSMVLYDMVGQYGTSTSYYSLWNIFSAGSILNIIVIGVIFYLARKPIMNGVIAREGL